MTLFYKTLKRQVSILILYTLGINFYELFFYESTHKGELTPLLLIPVYAIIHIIVILVYTASNHQDDRKKLKNYILTTVILLVLSISILAISLYLRPIH